jgi:hypothetical protein
VYSENALLTSEEEKITSCYRNQAECSRIT